MALYPLFLPDLNTTAQRRRFGQLFSAAVLRDALLGPAFTGQSLPEIAYLLSRDQYALWERILTGAYYCGRSPHNASGSLLTQQHFSRWCFLLNRTLHDHFRGPATDEVRRRLLNWGTMLRHEQLIRSYQPITLLSGMAA